MDAVETKPGGTGKSKPTDSSGNGGLKKEIEQIKERTKSLQDQAEIQRKLSPLVEDYGYTLTKLTTLQQLYNAAQKEGKKITPEMASSFEALAEAAAQAEVGINKIKASQNDLLDKLNQVKDVSHDVTRTFIDSMIDGKNATEALGDAISRLGQRLLDAGLDTLFDNIFKAGSGSGWLGKTLGFVGGGYTGPGGKYQPAGMVHKGEVVWSQDDVKRWGGPQMVEAMRKGYAEGGIVGGPVIPQMPHFPSAQELRAMADRSQERRIQVDVTPSPYFDVRVTEISRQETASGVKSYDKELNKTIGIKMSNARNLNRSGF